MSCQSVDVKGWIEEYLECHWELKKWEREGDLVMLKSLSEKEREREREGSPLNNNNNNKYIHTILVRKAMPATLAPN